MKSGAPSYLLALWARRCFVRAAFLARCNWLHAGSRNQISNAAHDWAPSDWFNLPSSLVIVVRAVARAVGTAGAKAIANITNAATEIVMAICLSMANNAMGEGVFLGDV
jgi:hypothetical protein